MSDLPRTRAAVFLDRDGVLNLDVGYAHRPDQLELLPNIKQGLRNLHKAGFLLIVVTNQSGVARGYYKEEDIRLFHSAMDQALIEMVGIKMDAYYHCPHHTKGSVSPWNVRCECRKPGTLMLDEASRSFGIDFKKSYLVGDKISDIDCGKAARCKTIQIKGKYDFHKEPDFFADDINSASRWILGN